MKSVPRFGSRRINKKALLFSAISCIYVVLQYNIVLHHHLDEDPEKIDTDVDVDVDRFHDPRPKNQRGSVVSETIPIDRPGSTPREKKKKKKKTNKPGGGSSEAPQPVRIIGPRQQHQLERAASIDYFACCGAGHRLSKLADVYHVAKRLGFPVRVFFGFCDHREVFSDLFGARPLNEAQVLATIDEGFRNGKDVNVLPDMYLQIGNEVPGFRKLVRSGRGDRFANATTTTTTSTTTTTTTTTTTAAVAAEPCPCLGSHNRFDSDVELFTDLRDNRFRNRDKIDAFRRTYFAGHTVIGLHVRAGNGEEGDFVRKNRTIEDIDRWCQSMSNTLISLSNDFDANEPPVVFIASDTADVIEKLRTLLEGRMRVLDFRQDRIDPGSGVLFGAAGNVDTNSSRCKLGWWESFADMMLLSHADVLVAGRSSSFTQALPMTLVLATPASSRRVRRPFCEVDPTATALACFEDLSDWCCNGTTSFSRTTTQAYDLRMMPPPGGLDLDGLRSRMKRRPRGFRDCIPKPISDCLPYEMPDERFLRTLNP